MHLYIRRERLDQLLDVRGGALRVSGRVADAIEAEQAQRTADGVLVRRPLIPFDGVASILKARHHREYALRCNEDMPGGEVVIVIQHALEIGRASCRERVS